MFGAAGCRPCRRRPPASRGSVVQARVLSLTSVQPSLGRFRKQRPMLICWWDPWLPAPKQAPKTGSTSVLTLLGTCTGNNETDKATCFKPLEVGRRLGGVLTDRWPLGALRDCGRQAGGGVGARGGVQARPPAARLLCLCRRARQLRLAWGHGQPPQDAGRPGACRRAATLPLRTPPLLLLRAVFRPSLHTYMRSPAPAGHAVAGGLCRHVRSILRVDGGAQPLGARRLLLPHALALHEGAGGGGGAAVCSCVLCKLAASGMARRRCKTGGGAEFAPGACLLPPAAPHLPPPPARSVWCYVQHGCKDRVGGWNTVCMDVNHIPRVHNVYPLCTIDRWVGEAVSRVGASAGSGAAAQQQQQRQCGPLPVQRLGARGAGLKQ